jgi:hypothetical protein
MGVYKLKKKTRESEIIPAVLDLGSLKGSKEDKQKKGNLPENMEEYE